MSDTGLSFLWKDRKRHLGLPLSFTRYALSEDRLFVSVGFLNMKYEEILLYRIRDISASRTLAQRIFGVGTLIVLSSDKSRPNLEIRNIKNPMRVKELLHEQVEEMKLRRRVRVGEIMGDGDQDDDHDDDDDFKL